MQTVAYIASLVAFVSGIMVLIKLFQKEGILKGILGLICMLYTFIWGWMKAKELDLTKVMWVWTGVIILSILINVVASFSAASGG